MDQLNLHPKSTMFLKSSIEPIDLELDENILTDKIAKFMAESIDTEQTKKADRDVTFKIDN